MSGEVSGTAPPFKTVSKYQKKGNKSWMGIFPKVVILETFVRVEKLLETCVEKIKDLLKKIMGVP